MENNFNKTKLLRVIEQSLSIIARADSPAFLKYLNNGEEIEIKDINGNIFYYYFSYENGEHGFRISQSDQSYELYRSFSNENLELLDILTDFEMNFPSNFYATLDNLEECTKEGFVRIAPVFMIRKV